MTASTATDTERLSDADLAAKARLDLEHLADLAVELEPALIFATPFGTRVTYVVRSGVLRGARLNGELLPGGGDWLTFGSDGIGRLDVRATLRLEDGALVHLTVTGVVVLPDAARQRLARGERLEEDELHARSQLRFEADPDGPHAWLNALTTVAVNALGPDHVDYRILRVL